MKTLTMISISLFSFAVLAHGPHSHIKCFTGKNIEEVQKKVNKFAGGHDHLTGEFANSSEPNHRGIIIDAMTKDMPDGPEICISYKHSHR
ncbi:hypothetical protein N9N67_00965 [Bacteriovoracaceae bacterium]|nr:hypothetical protein [Bacteriovoracaceae bacterium]